MDGMAAGNSAIIGVTLGILAYVSSHIEYASYLNIMYIPGSEELVIFICAFIGALIGFLWYNAFPAQVFMGDTGSLTIGGIIAVFAIIIHKELLIPILCGIFLVENLSVILQVRYFKSGKKKGLKRRIFKRTPIHHQYPYYTITTRSEPHAPDNISKQCLSRNRNYSFASDCHYCISSNTNYNFKDKISDHGKKNCHFRELAKAVREQPCWHRNKVSIHLFLTCL